MSETRNLRIFLFLLVQIQAAAETKVGRPELAVGEHGEQLSLQVIGLVVIIALVVIVIWMFRYASKH